MKTASRLGGCFLGLAHAQEGKQTDQADNYCQYRADLFEHISRKRRHEGGEPIPKEE